MKRILLVTITSLLLALGIASSPGGAARDEAPLGPATDQPKPQYQMLP
jgi:hypothetical protein